MKSKALERAGKADRVKCCVQTDRTKDLIPALFFIYIVSCLGGQVYTTLINSTKVVLFSFLGRVLFRIKTNNTNV